MILKDKPVGGASTGPTRCGLLGLAHKHIINFQFLQKQTWLGLCTYSETWVSSELGMSRDYMSNTSLFPRENLRMLQKGQQVLRGTSPIPSSHNGEEGDTVQDLKEEVASLEELLSQIGTPSKTPFRFG